MTDKEMQKELKKRLEELLRREVWKKSENMVQYCVKECARIVPLSKNNYISIEKPRIKTSFCFGYSLSRYDTEDYDNANKMADYASRSEEYFIKENMKQFDEVNLLENEDYRVVLITHYYDQPKDSEYKKLCFKRWYEEKADDEIELTDDDKKAIKEAYEIEKEAFRKRLNTYLKRYGTSKLRTWSYWQDA